ncbi:A/G-specific adenine glycosylase [Immundisolibacter sp.]|uniref:A/G-specific adenine glycosylase n=1 Tax=Immundisolibacter sp. TaxID=1934948 RepID=UPI0026136F3A|nr:A/G-specific adenine glycosylase [Immundisolibacter sp.]MDD3650018.1 A/G-specific adenine glycosylase [Immundisolibacter sp.]
MSTASFAERLLAWHARAGRHDLPWQRPRTPYRVWVSEIMLQQTQVATVIPYFERFMARFADLPALAAAPLDEVLHLWTGLGYYARARHLHRAAAQVCREHGGELPTDIEALAALPGIGRSTAAAILAQAHDQRQPILDGNVKRVLCRHRAVAGWPGAAAVQKTLWQLAERYTPPGDAAAYTQAIMDLGALVCTRHRPRCADCPVAADCLAHTTASVADYPQPRPRRVLPQRETALLLLRRDDGSVLLERRPPAGVWGGLWSLPQFDGDPATLAERCRQRFGIAISGPVRRGEPFVHTFSHFRLRITPLECTVAPAAAALDAPDLLWYNPIDPPRLGLATPIRRLLVA